MDDLEKRILQAFRSMSDDCRADAIASMEAWAKAFPRRQATMLTLIVGGSLRTIQMQHKVG
jgi:hypothetical protein